MKIYRIGMYENPTTEKLMALKAVEFADFSAVGTWVNERDKCQACGWHWQIRVPPLLVQWEPSTDVIGDFSWDGPFGMVFVVKEHVADALQAAGFECRFLPVEYVRPVEKGKLKCVAFPYAGPKLLWGAPEGLLDLDMQASEVVRKSSCAICGDVRYTFRSHGIVIHRRDWHGEKMFRIRTNGRSAATFVTEEGRRRIEEAGFSNIRFSEVGEIVD